ncbi:RsbRD N-terminal domain-containing protein [Candidatus Poribacteria bacterium]|nr:RsbRD N-terminal domain-containing protein [Candidatus Poribacteria bacterium]
MKLENLLSRKRSAIVERWFQLILDTYPADTSSFLKRQKDRFANPVGNTISQGIEGIYDGLVQSEGPDKVSPFLDTIIRIRAIQDFSPSQGVAFVFSLKKAIREELKDEMRDEEVARELLALESRIDELALLSFDIYMKCREKVYELRANEVKNRTFKLLERANLISEVPDLNPGSEGDNVEKKK